MNRNRRSLHVCGSLLAGVLGIALSAPAQAVVLYEQGVAYPAPDGAESTGDDQTPPAATESADNFVLNQRVEVSSIDWWGAYDPDVPAAGDDFTLRIFADNGGSPSNSPLTEYTGISPSRTSTMTNDVGGGEIFAYSTGVAAGLQLDAGTYYLSVVDAVNLTSDPVIWFWTQGAGGDSTNWERDTATGPNPAWTTSAAPLDLAFRIEGDLVGGAAVPVLPTLLLMAPFAAFLGRRRAMD